MKPIARFASVLLVAAMGAATAADRTPPKSDVPPPPGMDEPGVTTAPQPATAAEPAAARTQADDPLAPLPKPDARLVRDKASRDKAATDDRIARSEVTKRKQGDDTVEEYRQNGRIWMIKIIPITGPSQTFMANDGSGRLVRDPKEGPVSPVYYSLYEWK